MTRKDFFTVIVICILLALGLRGETKKPAVLMLCEIGGAKRTPGEGHLASGGNCVIHDASGAIVVADSVGVYDNGEGP
jgi:hypothetical protein